MDVILGFVSKRRGIGWRRTHEPCVPTFEERIFIFVKDGD